MVAYTNFIAPRFFIEIDGRTADFLIPHVAKFEYKDSAKKADELTITLNNKGLLWQDDFRFARGSTIKTRFGYPGMRMSDIKTLTVVEAGLRLDDELPVFEIKAHDKDRTRLTKKGVGSEAESKAKNWGFIPSSGIAAAIAKRYGLKADVEDSKDARKEFRIQPANMNDYEAMGQLAKTLNWEFYIEAGILHFHPHRMQSAPMSEYNYYSDQTGQVIEFSAELKLKKPGKTGKAGANPQNGTAPAGDADAKTTGEGKAGKYAIIALDRGAVYIPTAETDPNVITIHARAQQGNQELNALKSNVTLIGDPGLMSKRILRLQGIGAAYIGDWRIHEARHIINADGRVYTTECELKRNALGTGDKKDKVKDKSLPVTDANPAGPSTVTVWSSVGGIEALSSTGEDWRASIGKP
jgi:phage protein D